jgi:uncharacterized protein
MKTVPVIVFAKAPVPGQVKTRLAATLGEAGAARLAARMLRHAVDQATRAAIGPVTLCAAPDGRHPVWAELVAQHGVQLMEQGDGDLGQRMARALSRVLASQANTGTASCPLRGALLIGTDVPALDSAYLRQAAAALGSHEAVFGPTADGGYVLVGLRHPQPSLFEAMRWSHDRVMDETRHRLAAAGLTHAELPVLHDVDVAADLAHVPADWLPAA